MYAFTIPRWRCPCGDISAKNQVMCINDLRPVAVTSEVVKACERIVLPQLRHIVVDSIDPMQFAYRRDRSCEDAIITVLDAVSSHLDHKAVAEYNASMGKRRKCSNQARIMFYDFSSAFNTIQPYALAHKLIKMAVPPTMILWLLSYLT